MQQKLEDLCQEKEKLQVALTDFQRQYDILEEEKEDALRDWDRAQKEIERG